MKPRNGLVLVEVLPQEKNRKTEQGIILPDTKGTGGYYRRAVILSVGPGFPSDVGPRVGTEDLREGQLVLIKAGHLTQVSEFQQADTKNGATVVVDGKEQVLINQQDILAIIAEKHIEVVPAGDDLDHGFITKETT